MRTPNLEEWPNRLREILKTSPIVQGILIDTAPSISDRVLGGEAEFLVGDEAHRLKIVCQLSGQPRHIRYAINQLGPQNFSPKSLIRGLVVAPFISLASRTILAESNIGWLDMAGNFRIVFPRFHLEILTTTRDPFATKREQRSLFFPKSARLLKILLHRPQQAWKISNLASEAGVSAGQVSNVRKALINKEWAATETGEGFRLTQPNALLDAWRDDGAQAPHIQIRGYTILHGQKLDEAIEKAFTEAANEGAKILLASHSVARRIAPFVRIAGEFFYADAAGLAILSRHLKIAPTDKGENVTIYRADDEGIWQETMGLMNKLNATGPIQTYIDLLSSGERGREAAEHFRTEKINPMLREGS